MRNRLKRPSPAMGVALVALFIALGGTTYAATGGNFILGNPNSATSATALTSNNAGKALNIIQQSTGAGATALGLNVPAGKPPLAVNSATKVANLNADKLDGLDSSGFLRNQLDENWHYIGDAGEPAFQNGWVNYDPATDHPSATFQHAAYYRDKLGILHLGGLIKSGPIGTTVFALPGFGLCPYYFRTWAQISESGLARVTLTYQEPNGFCRLVVNSGSNGWVSLDGISYRAWNAGDANASPANATGRTATRASLP